MTVFKLQVTYKRTDMRQNYRGNKKRIEETKRKKQEQKRLRRMGKGPENPLPVSSEAPAENVMPETSA